MKKERVIISVYHGLDVKQSIEKVGIAMAQNIDGGVATFKDDTAISHERTKAGSHKFLVYKLD